MKLLKKSIILKSPAFLLTFFFFLSFNVNAQDNIEKSLDSIEKSNTIAIGNISEETEKVAQLIKKLEKVLKPSTEIKEVDSLMNIISLKFDEKKDSIYSLLKSASRREIQEINVEWLDLQSTLNEYQINLKDRSEEVSDISNDLVTEINKWELTKKSLESASSKKNTYEGIDAVIETLQETLNFAQDRLENVFNIQSELTKLVLYVDDLITEIEVTQTQMKKDYFVFDSQPIWKKDTTNILVANIVESPKIDSSNKTKVSLVKHSLLDFISSNIQTFVFQIVFILFLLLIIIKANKNWKKELDELSTPVEKQTKIILTHPIAAALVAGVLGSYFFYIAVIPSYSEISMFLVLLGTTYLLPRLTDKRFVIPLLLLFVAFIINTYSEFLNLSTGQIRWFLILTLVIIIIALELARRLVNTYPEKFRPINKFIRIISPIYIFISIIGIIGNIIGMVSLSSFVIRGVLYSTILGFVVFLVVRIMTSLVIVLFNFRKTPNIQTLSTIIDVSNRRIQPALHWFGVFIWLKFTLRSFGLHDPFINRIKELMQEEWLVGEVTISLGGIIAFSSIVAVTLLLAKLIGNIFQDEWVINMLPRGASSAMSLMLKILVVCVGFYLALTAIGLDFSKLSLLIGALGVGIGFGLQNVVSNFISGLILAFERPINIGDSIEIDQEMGVVTNIGVRSSNIRTYSGAEAIIPNGDLISKKVVNWTLSNRDRRSKILMKTAPSADPNKVIELFNSIASENEYTFKTPTPKTYFYGYDETGNLSFALLFWTTFSDTLKTDHAVSLSIFEKLKEEGITAPAPVRRIINE